jgi:glutamate/aspartate transport system permease protein
MSSFDWRIIISSLPFLAEGMLLSLLLVAVATIGGVIFGAALAFMRQSCIRPVTLIAAGYVNLMRLIPLVLLLFWFYFLVPLAVGRPVGALASALIAFVLFEAAFYCEIIRAGIASVGNGQIAAALATGLRRPQVMRFIILPQAIRAMIPLLLNQIILVFQDTALVYVVALRDFMTAASVVASRDGRAVELYTFVAVVYLMICLSTSLFVTRVWARQAA